MATLQTAAVQTAAVQTANATAAQTQVAIDARDKRGPHNNKLPKFSAKDNEVFIDWYDDVLCILALDEWSHIYDSSTNDLCLATTTANAKLSEHLYTAIRLALQGKAGSVMKGYEHRFRNRGVELLHQMKPIFHPKWPTSLHNEKQIAFFQYFRLPTVSIDEYSNKFKHLLYNLRYNGITITTESAKHAFIQGLGAEFISIQNQDTLPTPFQTNDIDTLTSNAREHLARIMGNREIQKKQKAIIRQSEALTPPSQSNNTNTPAPQQS